MSRTGWRCVCALLLTACSAANVDAATIYVAAGGDLQNALNAARPGDTVVLAEGAEFVGNFVLPVTVGDGWITVRSSAPDSVLPAAGVRIQPSHAPLLARLRSPNTAAALRTAPGAHHWVLAYLELPANQNGYGDILQIGDGSSAQNSLDKVPHHIVLSHVYVHGDPQLGQKRGIALNAAHVTITDSYVSDCKAVGQDTQAVGGWNGPGPYTIENNYFEAAGENVLFGGADPAIANLVADGITFRRNYLARPMAWRSPIVATPTGVTAAAESGGSLAAGTYSYRVVARRTVGQGVVARSTASAEVTATTAASGAVRVRWTAVPGAAEYRVYGRAAGAENTYWRVTGTELLDTGLAGTAESVPATTGTVWSVKNLFELKNARNVVVEANVFENHWKESQPGYAIVLTPRNSGGSCTWCVVEHVRFEYNIVRNVSAAVNLTGYDSPSSPTRQSNDIAFRHNLFTGVTTALGGNGWLLQIGDEPRDITLEHNTFDSNGSTVVYVYGGTSTDPREVYGFRMVANAARHGSYGMNGAYFTYGNAILAGFYPDAVFSANFLSGGSASRYPAGNLFTGLFPDQFVDPSNGDYALRSGSVLQGAAPDGSDVGADHAQVMAKTAGVEAGVTGGPAVVGPKADFTTACTYLECAFHDTSIAGSSGIVSRSWAFGDAAVGAGTDAVHAYASAGTFVVRLTVVDGNGLSASADETVTVAAALPPAAALSVTCTSLACAFADTSTPGSGAIVSRSWTFGDGAVSSASSGSHTFALAGSYAIGLTVTDVNGLSASASKTVSVSAVNLPPVASFATSCADLRCTFTCTSADADGSVLSRKWAFSDGATAEGGSVTRNLSAPGAYGVTLTVSDDDGATASASATVPVTALLHVGDLDGTRTTWTTGGKRYWSATVTIAVHGGDERLVSNARVDVAWSGAVVKTGSCVTNGAGTCTVASGTLSWHNTTVKLDVRGVSAASSAYTAKNHDPDGSSNGTSVTVKKSN